MDKLLINNLVVCPSNSPTRFVDNGDGTICDHQTGLMWEKKDGAGGSPNFDNTRDVDNPYTWSSIGTAPDGTAFTDFLARLNGEVASTSPSEQLGGHSDRRLPSSAELQTIVACSFGSPCIAPVFGLTAASFASNPNRAWFVNFSNGAVNDVGKSSDFRVRAVRGGR